MTRWSLFLQTLSLLTPLPGTLFAYAGDNWNATNKRLESSRLAIGTDIRTSILVEFNQPMDDGSLQPTDFTVDGVNPTAVAHFAALNTGAFLTVPTMSPSATPVVALVGEVKDTSGNALSTGTVTALDGMAPGLTASIANNYTKADIELNVKSDEPIAGSRPNIIINRCDTFKTGDCTVRVTPTISTSIVTERAEWNFKLIGLGKGLYNVQVDATDVKVNSGKVGNADPSNAAALDFEIDATLPAPGAETATPQDPVTKDVLLSDPIILKIDWNSEGDGSEYLGDSHSKVELTKAELDGVNVLNLASSKGGEMREWTITVPKSVLGATEADQVKLHKLVYNGEDELGTPLAADRTFEFTVIKKPAYQVTLQPGINLVSLPSDPASSKIDDVITNKDDVNLVFTYDPSDPRGPWLFASRTDMTQPFQGDLKTIDARHAYFVRAISVVVLKVDLPIPDPLKLFIPPTLSVQLGWNLIPVSDIRQSAAGVKIDADDYLAGDQVGSGPHLRPDPSPAMAARFTRCGEQRPAGGRRLLGVVHRTRADNPVNPGQDTSQKGALPAWEGSLVIWVVQQACPDLGTTA